VKALLPNEFHEKDRSGRLLYIFQLGSLKLGELFDAFSNEQLIAYFAQRLEDKLKNEGLLTCPH